MAGHSMEYHKKALSYLCRTCKMRSVPRSIPKTFRKRQVAAYKDRILEYFGIDVSKDQNTKFPDKLCTKCYAFMQVNRKTSKDTLRREEAKKLNSLWSDFDSTDQDCYACDLFTRSMGIQNQRSSKNGLVKHEMTSSTPICKPHTSWISRYEKDKAHTPATPSSSILQSNSDPIVHLQQMLDDVRDDALKITPQSGGSNMDDQTPNTISAPHGSLPLQPKTLFHFSLPQQRSSDFPSQPPPPGEEHLAKLSSSYHSDASVTPPSV